MLIAKPVSPIRTSGGFDVSGLPDQSTPQSAPGKTIAIRVSRSRTARVSRRLLRSAAAVVMAIALSGCSVLNGSSDQGGENSGDNSGNSRVEKSAVTIGILQTPDDAPVELAKIDGFFTAEGLNPTIKVFKQGPDMYPALANGSLDFALTNYVSFFKAAANRTLSAKVVADAYAATPNALVVIVGPNSPIKSVADLQGQKIATQAPGNINELLVRDLLDTNHLNPNSPTYLPVHFPDMASALADGSVGAITELEPYITEAERQDHDVVPQSFHLISGATNDMPLSGYIASDSEIAKDPRTVAAFQRAMVRANATITQPGKPGQPSPAEQVLPQVTGVDPKLVPMLKPNLGTYPTSLDPKRLQRVVTLMKDFGGFTQALNVQTLIVPLAA